MLDSADCTMCNHMLDAATILVTQNSKIYLKTLTADMDLAEVLDSADNTMCHHTMDAVKVHVAHKEEASPHRQWKQDKHQQNWSQKQPGSQAPHSQQACLAKMSTHDQPHLMSVWERQEGSTF